MYIESVTWKNVKFLLNRLQTESSRAPTESTRSGMYEINIRPDLITNPIRLLKFQSIFQHTEYWTKIWTLFKTMF